MTADTPARGQIPSLRALWKEAFGDGDAFLDTFFTTAFSPDRCRCTAVGADAAAALYWFDCTWQNRRAAYIYAVAAARAYRGQGIASALMEDTHRHLQSCGYDGAVLVPGSGELFRFYRRFGYRECSRIREIRCTASAVAAEIRRTDAEEYARLRRRYLPENGVLQEGENLRFLQTQASFYTGDGFVLAAYREGDLLHGTELLGRADAAPAIVRAMGCTEGQFRIPGDDRPFTMFLPLRDTPVPPPSYFGLAFD
ncbi:MAG: GNAT family N-acetyltransferase [Clostridia bacterium]|nr:GNAT family N-acetyltransferase [Clostridia bacterium]